MLLVPMSPPAHHRSLAVWTAGLLLFALTCPASFLGAQDQRSAFRSLFIASKEAPGARLVEISGEQGAPQPAAWRFLYADPSARGGVREIVVKGGALESVRTPLKGFTDISTLEAIPLDSLGVDSNQAFQTANAEATNARLAFHWLDYSLRTTPSGSAAWRISLRDNANLPVGELSISAATGEIISPLRRLDAQTTATPAPVGGLVGDVRDLGTGIAKKTSNVVLRTVGTVQEVLTGRRTIGPTDSDSD